jgi:uncharacterized metal-binding protein
MDSEKVYIIPCSGIGKATASVGRDATYKVIEDKRPATSDTLCLSLLTMGDKEAADKVRKNKVITIEGCAKDCARKNVEASGAAPDISHRVHDFLKEHRDLKPETVLDVGEGGRQLTEIIAEQVADEVDDLIGKA